MLRIARRVIVASLVLGLAAPLIAQGTAAPPPGQAAPAAPALPPATKLEGFQPAAGSVVTFGYDELGNLGFGGGVSVDVRELRDTKGGVARGLVVDVTQDQFRKESAFVDADEIPELLKGVDALLGVKANPTQFTMFEVRYTTRGALQITAFSDPKGQIHYGVRAGRTLTAMRALDATDLTKLRGMFEAGLRKLDATASGK